MDEAKTEEKVEPRIKMGAPKKREKVVSDIADSLNIVLSTEVLSLADMSGFPQLQNEKPRNQLIMCGIACGIRQSSIAESLGVSRQAIHDLINRIDPEGVFRVSKDAKKAFITQMMESVAIEALQHITNEKLEDAPAKELAGIIKTMTDSCQSMNQSKHREVAAGKLDMMMDQALMQIDKADVEEVK